MRSLHIIAAVMLWSAGSLAHACSKPTSPSSKSGYGGYMNETFNYLECMHKQMVLDPLESGRARGNQHSENQRRYESMKEEVVAEMESVRRTLESGGTPSGGGDGYVNDGNSGSGGPLSGGNCSELQRQAESRMRQLQSRLQSAGLCESYRISEELGQIGVQMYSQCRILDPGGAALAAAQQMVRDGSQGQAQACTR